jgi:hypothetical protein
MVQGGGVWGAVGAGRCGCRVSERSRGGWLGTRPGGGVFCVKVHVVLFDGQGCEAVGSLSFVPQALLYC